MRRAQSTIEYVIVVGCLAAALITVGVYMRRGYQGNIRSLADQVGEHYEPGKTTIESHETTTTIASETTIGNSFDGTFTAQNSDTTENKIIDRDSDENLGKLN